QAVSQFQTDMLASADPGRSLGEKLTVLEVITSAGKELDGGRLKGQPLVEATVRDIIGSTMMQLGRYQDAEPQLRAALECRRQALSAGAPLLADSLNNLATLLQFEGKLDAAEPLYREAADIFRKVIPSLPEAATHLAVTTGNLGILLKDKGRLAESEPLL